MENKSAMMRKFIILATLLSAIHVCSVGSSLNLVGSLLNPFEQTSPLVWRPTGEYADRGIMHYKFVLKMTSPCRILDKFYPPMNKSSKGTNYDLEKSAVIKVCEQDYQNYIVGSIRNISAQFKRPGLLRKKRFILGFIAGFFVSNVVSVIREAITDYFSYPTDKINSRLYSLNEAVKVENQTHYAQLDISQKIYREVRETDTKVNWLHDIWPQLGWTLAAINNGINSKFMTLQRIERSLKHDKLDVDALSILVEDDWLRGIDWKTVKIIDISALDNGETLEIEFYSNKKALDTEIVRVEAFDIWTNISGEPYLNSYKGPKFVFVNRTSGCVRPVDDQSLTNIITYCPWFGYVEPSVHDWVASKRLKTADQIKQKTILKTDLPYNLIYCFPGSLIISGMKYSCPIYPFKLKADFSWNTSDYEFKGIPAETYVSVVKNVIAIPEGISKRVDALINSEKVEPEMFENLKELARRYEEGENKTDLAGIYEKYGDHHLINKAFIIIALLIAYFFGRRSSVRR